MTDLPQPPDPIDAEIVPSVTLEPPAPDYDHRGVPSLDFVRDKIEGRYATSSGTSEPAQAAPAARSLDEQLAERERAASARLDEIRRTLG